MVGPPLPTLFTPEMALDVRSVSIAVVTGDGHRVAATVRTRRDRTDVDHQRYGDPTYISPTTMRLMVIPLLMLSGEGDWNVPATNQREMNYALRRLGKEVVWVHYTAGGHGAGRASTAAHFVDHWQRMFDWFAEHFGEEELDGHNSRSIGC